MSINKLGAQVSQSGIANLSPSVQQAQIQPAQTTQAGEVTTPSRVQTNQFEVGSTATQAFAGGAAQHVGDQATTGQTRSTSLSRLLLNNDVHPLRDSLLETFSNLERGNALATPPNVAGMEHVFLKDSRMVDGPRYDAFVDQTKNQFFMEVTGAGMGGPDTIGPFWYGPFPLSQESSTSQRPPIAINPFPDITGQTGGGQVGGNVGQVGGNGPQIAINPFPNSIGGNAGQVGGNVGQVGGNVGQVGGNGPQIAINPFPDLTGQTGGGVGQVGGNVGQVGGNVDQVGGNGPQIAINPFPNSIGGNAGQVGGNAGQVGGNTGQVGGGAGQVGGNGPQIAINPFPDITGQRGGGN